MKWNLIIDVAECHNCGNCAVAAKDEHVGNDFPGYSAPHAPQGAGVIRVERQVRGSGHLVDAAHVPRMCNHCDDAPCVKAGGSAVNKRADGIVIIDPVQARGRRDLVDSCPYGAIVWNEEQQLPQAWIFDAHLLDGGWAQPRNVSVCPTRAIEAVKLSDEAMAERARDEALRVLQPELKTKPRVYYRNLHRADRCFIGGSVTARVAGKLECAAAAEVHLLRGGQTVDTVRSDAFGDFRFDNLPAGAGRYQVRAVHPRLGQAECEAVLDADSLVLPTLQMA